MTGILDAFVYSLPLAHGYSIWGLTFLLEMVVKGTVLLLFAAALAVVLRRTSAASRHLVWTLALGAILALPVLVMILPSWRVPIFPSAPGIAASAPVTAKRDSPAGPQTPQTVQANMAQQPTGLVWPGLVLLLWGIGSALFVTRMVVGEIRVRRLVRCSQRFERSAAKSILEKVSRHLRIRRAVEVRASAEIGVPFTRGIFHPVVFLPEEAREWPQEQLEFVLAHELGHVNRRDHLTQILAQTACALMWFHPLVWLAAVQMRKERERACDDLVLILGHRATDYAEFLLSLGRSLRGLQPAWSTGISMAQSSQLEVRMKSLLNPRLNHRPLAARTATLAAILTIALLVPAAAIHATGGKDTGNISGIVRDPSGDVIPGAAVTLINLRTQEKIEIGTGPDGSFSFPAIPAARYQLEIAAPGFVRQRSSVLDLKPSRALHEVVALDVGEVTQNITVTGQRLAGSEPSPHRAPRRIRVGGHVTAPKLTRIVKPVYPASAKEQGIQGTVLLRAIIGANGRIITEVTYNGANPALVKAALDATRQWRYEPALLNGVPVTVTTTITVVFRLDQKSGNVAFGPGNISGSGSL